MKHLVKVKVNYFTHNPLTVLSTLDDVYHHNKELLIPETASGPDDRYIDHFLIQLRDGSANCKRLLVYIGIDLKNFFPAFPGAGNPFIGLLRNIILHTRTMKPCRTVPAPEYTYAMRFTQSLKGMTWRHPDAAVRVNSMASYFRITPFVNYMRYVVANNLKNNPDLPASLDLDEEESLDGYFNEFSNEEKYHQLNISKLGHTGSWVFVADSSSLASGFEINNLKAGEPYIYLKYPESFEEAIYQPTSLMVDWDRAWPVSGSRPSMKERTHSWFDHGAAKTYAFTAAYMGRLTSSVTSGSGEQIIDEALKQFDEA